MIKSGMHLDGLVFKDDQSFPEQERKGFPKVRRGVAISGGGTRSAALAAGQLRALYDAKKFEEYSYVSMVSGGAWGGLPLFYLSEGAKIEEYLGAGIPPEKVQWKSLWSNSRSVARSTTEAFLGLETVASLLAGDEAYAAALGWSFLRPWDLDKPKFLAWTKASCQEILGLSHNAHLELGDFHLAQDRWGTQPAPFPIVGGTLVRSSDYYHFEMTPLYAGVSGTFPNAGSRPPSAEQGQGLGGGKVAPHLFDTASPTGLAPGSPSVATARLSTPSNAFSLRDVLAVTGCAPRALFDAFFFPNFRYWSPTFVETNGERDQEYDFGDGGLLENLGIMPLLRRRCTEIVVFINTEADVAQLDLERFLKDGTAKDKTLCDSLVPLFQPVKSRKNGLYFGNNVVFDNKGDPESPLHRLLRTLHTQAKQGEIASCQETYTVVDNPHYGIAGGWEVKVTWVHNCLPQEWLNALPPDLGKDAENRWRASGSRPFPFLATFFQNPPFVVRLNSAEAGLLGHLSWWITGKLVASKLI